MKKQILDTSRIWYWPMRFVTGPEFLRVRDRRVSHWIIRRVVTSRRYHLVFLPAVALLLFPGVFFVLLSHWYWVSFTPITDKRILLGMFSTSVFTWIMWLTVLAIVARFTLWQEFRRQINHAGIPVCIRCGYDTHGCVGRCPECGAAADFVKVDRCQQVDHSVTPIMVATILTILIPLIGMSFGAVLAHKLAVYLEFVSGPVI